MYVEQYPDRLVRDDGSEIKCRFYPLKGLLGIRKVVDGTEINVKYAVAIPVDAPQLLIGENVTGYDRNGEVVIWRESIALFHRGQLHCVAYI